MMPACLLGIDIGTSAIKAAILRADDGVVLGEGTSPDSEMAIEAPRPGWAEQNPEVWWEHTVRAVQIALRSARISPEHVRAIGIAYQMHGLVAVDRRGQPVRPAIIWCDSRAVRTGEVLEEQLGRDYVLTHLLNPPGNFTISKLIWVREHEPEVFARIHSIMLPGDYVALRMTGEISTSISGLSEGIAWDFLTGAPSEALEQVLGIPRSMIPPARPSCAVHGELSAAGARELGLAAGTPIAYRAGDQPNNALALGVLTPGSTAASAGTSGVLFGVTTALAADPSGRVNTFMHVTGTAEEPVCGVLLCLNGVGSANRWCRELTCSGASYDMMNSSAAAVPIGADELTFLPFGNGSERLLRGAAPGALFAGIDFNRHGPAHLARAVQEGVACAFRLGANHLARLGVPVTELRAGAASMFQSPIFREALATLCGAPVRLFAADGAHGAARGAGIGAGIYSSAAESLVGLAHLSTTEPAIRSAEAWGEVWHRWQSRLSLNLPHEEL